MSGLCQEGLDALPIADLVAALGGVWLGSQKPRYKLMPNGSRALVLPSGRLLTDGPVAPSPATPGAALADVLFQRLPVTTGFTCGRPRHSATASLHSDEAREWFALHGVSIAAWAREHNVSRSTVYEVLAGRRKCHRGDSHKIAVLLGMKAKPASTE